MCSCIPISDLPCSAQRPLSNPEENSKASAKYYREIGAEMLGNRLIVRMEREKKKSRKDRGQWEPPCECVEIRRPTSKEGPKIINGGDCNQILFRTPSKPRFGFKEEPNHKSQTIVYEVGECRGGRNTNEQCRTITIRPRASGQGYQEVHTDRVIDADQNVFLLRIKKKPESTERKKRNIELELRTPKLAAFPITSPESTGKPTEELDDREKAKKETKRKTKKK